MPPKSSAPPFVARQVIRGRYLFCPLNKRQNTASLRVLCAGVEECSPDYEVRRDGFHCAALELIAGGEWELTSERGQWRLTPGMIFTYGPGVCYSLCARSSHGLRKCFLDLEGPDAAPALRLAGLRPGVPARLAHPRWTQDLVEQLIDAARMGDRKREKLGMMLARLLIERLRVDRDAGGASIPASLVTFERCREYLAGRYLEIDDLAQAARACGVSQVHLCRLFRRHAGKTPQEFVTHMKLNHAAELIMRGNISVKAAGLEVGYGDPYHFSKAFKKAHGVAPSLFRGRCL